MFTRLLFGSHVVDVSWPILRAQFNVCDDSELVLFIYSERLGSSFIFICNIYMKAVVD